MVNIKGKVYRLFREELLQRAFVPRASLQRGFGAGRRGSHGDFDAQGVLRGTDERGKHRNRRVRQARLPPPHPVRSQRLPRITSLSTSTHAILEHLRNLDLLRSSHVPPFESVDYMYFQTISHQF